MKKRENNSGHSLGTMLNSGMLNIILNGLPTAKLSYDVSLAQWAEKKPALFFHVEGDTGRKVSGFLTMNEDLANILCQAFNEKYFPNKD